MDLARAVLLGLGSRGDLAPLLTLAQELRGRGREVVVVGLREYAPLVAAVQAEFIPVEVDVTDALWTPSPSARRAMIAQPGLMYLGMRSRLSRVTTCVLDAVGEALRPGDVVVAGLATAGVAVALRRWGYTVVLALFAPVMPTRRAASTVMGARTDGAATLGVSSTAWVMSVEMSGAAGRAMYRLDRPERLDRLGPVETAVEALGLPILLAASPVLVPPADDWPAGVRQTGAWRASPPATAHEVARLEAFSAAGEPPVYIGFGTCPSADPRADLSMFVAAARRAGRRLVVQPSFPVGDLGPEVLAVGEMPHDVLFGATAGVVHHGGAGTTVAALNAGVPSAVVPHLGDQPYWGRRVEALGAGPPPVPRSRLTTRRLTRLLHALEDTDPDVPGQLATRLRGENGVLLAADHLDELAQRSVTETAGPRRDGSPRRRD